MAKPKVKFVPKKIHVKKDDMVYITSGKDKGKVGKVLKVFPKKGKVIVEGVNIVTKHMKPNQMNPQGGVVERPAPMYSSKVMLYCESCSKPTRITKKVLEDGKKVRICKHCEEVI